MKPNTRSPDIRTLIQRIPAEARDVPDIVVAHLRPYARMVAVWRQDDVRPGRWVYLERMYAQDFSVDEVIQRYGGGDYRDRKSTRLNSSHGYISYAVFCLKKKNTNKYPQKSHANKRNRVELYVVAH